VEWDPGPRANPLVTTIILFGPASVVLASVSPIAIRLAVRSVETAGRTAGRLYAISTAGSIAGTLITAFWLVPELGVSQLLAAAATVLLGAVVLVALAERLPVVAIVAMAFTAAAAVATSSLAPDREGQRLEGVAAQNWSPLYRSREEASREIDQAAGGFDVVFQKDTRYHHLAVVDDGSGSRYLRFDNSFQSGMTIDRPFETRFRYTDYFDLGLAYNPDARNILFVGLGGASAPKRIWRDFPSLDLQVAELDPVVVGVARQYFAMPDSPRLKVAVEDGRRYLQRNEQRYDVIALDAYFSDSIPFHLATAEFVDLVRQRLAPGGVVVANIIGSVDGPGSRLFRSFVRTYRTAFPTVAVHPVIEEGDGGGLTELRNLMLVASEGALPSEEFLVERWRGLAPATAPDLEKPIRDRYDRQIRIEDVPTLTDDYAPTDSLLLVD
jgi:spermidine synthase